MTLIDSVRAGFAEQAAVHGAEAAFEQAMAGADAWHAALCAKSNRRPMTDAARAERNAMFRTMLGAAA